MKKETDSSMVYRDKRPIAYKPPGSRAQRYEEDVAEASFLP